MKFLCKLLFLFTSMVKRDTWMQQQTQPFLWLQFHWLLELSCCWGMFHGNIWFLETISSYPMKYMWIKLNLDGNTRILQVLHCGIFWRQKVQFLGTIRRPCIYCRLGELAFLRISTSSYSGTTSGFWVVNSIRQLWWDLGELYQECLYFSDLRFEQFLEFLVMHLL